MSLSDFQTHKGKPKGHDPISMTIYGDAGTGKTSLAATFPNVLFIRAENGTKAIDPSIPFDQLDPLKSVDDLWDQLAAVLKGGHDRKTLAFDSVTKLETMFIDHVLRLDGKAKSLNQAMGGYGAGRAAVNAMHLRVRKAAQVIQDTLGMHVLFIAHADLEDMDLPDKDKYSRYTIRMDRKAVSPYIDDVDLVGQIRERVVVSEKDDGRLRAQSTGTHELICHMQPTSVSKNRFHIEKPLVVPKGQNPLIELIPALQGE